MASGELATGNCSSQIRDVLAIGTAMCVVAHILVAKWQVNVLRILLKHSRPDHAEQVPAQAQYTANRGTAKGTADLSMSTRSTANSAASAEGTADNNPSVPQDHEGTSASTGRTVAPLYSSIGPNRLSSYGGLQRRPDLEECTNPTSCECGCAAALPGSKGEQSAAPSTGPAAGGDVK